jgi:hypothetical protein
MRGEIHRPATATAFRPFDRLRALPSTVEGRLKPEATRSIVWVFATLFLFAASAAAQMPDARQMSGIPRPDPQLATGTVTVRVARGSFANPVDSLTVDLSVGGSPKQAATNAEGRAEFTGIAPGTRLKASAVVAGEKLESQEFAMPASGGVRLALIAVDPSGQSSTAAPAAPGVPAQRGEVMLGEDTRFVLEMGEDGLNVFYVLQFRNDAAAPVQPGKALVFELPEDARGAGLMEGSSPLAKLSGQRLEISGPFPPGDTLVQAGYTLPFGDAKITIEQPLPVSLKHVAVVAEKAGGMQLSSPQVRDQQDMPANGKVYIAGRGPAVDANQTLTLVFTGLPHHSTWPRDIALGLAFLILAGGAWSTFRGANKPAGVEVRRQTLETRRDDLFDELTALEGGHRQGLVDPEQFATRRRELVAALEQVYAALDDDIAVGHAS